MGVLTLNIFVEREIFYETKQFETNVSNIPYYCFYDNHFFIMLYDISKQRENGSIPCVPDNVVSCYCSHNYEPDIPAKSKGIWLEAREDQVFITQLCYPASLCVCGLSCYMAYRAWHIQYAEPE
jgi:hypothetical protein